MRVGGVEAGQDLAQLALVHAPEDIDRIVAIWRERKDDRVRVRVGNLTMTNHPIHMHGHRFEVTGTDGGWVRPEARWPEATIDIPVGSMRAYEFVADTPGDWAIHCHKAHHTMNAMGHNTRNFIGTNPRALSRQMRQIAPDYMAMGASGMADMGAMARNTSPI